MRARFGEGVAVMAVVTASLFLAGCQQRDASAGSAAPNAAEVAARAREDEFKWKERCSIAAERFDKLYAPRPGPRNATDPEMSVSEAFYSPSRNTCICEVSAVSKRGKLTNMLTLYDCLTREELATTLLDLNGNWKPVQDAWKQKKDQLERDAAPSK